MARGYELCGEVKLPKLFLTFWALYGLMLSFMNTESFKNLALAACVVLSAAAACSKKEEAPSDVTRMAGDVKSDANMCLAGSTEVVTGEISPFFIPGEEATEKSVKSPSKPSPGNINVKDLPVAGWYGDAEYDGCKGLDFRKAKDLKKMHEDCLFYDPNSPDGMGSPVLDLKGHYGKVISPHFKVRDFARIDPVDLKYIDQRHRGISDGIPVYRYARVDPELVSIMEEIRTAVGFPIVVDGGFRAFYHNVDMDLGRKESVKTRSQHVSGKAIDTELNLTFKALRAQCEKDSSSKACGLKSKSEMSGLLFKTAHGIMEKHGGGGIGVGNNQMHFDTRGGKRVATWGYDAWNRRKIGRWTKGK